jgi:hypothetical protein
MKTQFKLELMTAPRTREPLEGIDRDNQAA